MGEPAGVPRRKNGIIRSCSIGSVGAVARAAERLGNRPARQLGASPVRSVPRQPIPDIQGLRGFR